MLHGMSATTVASDSVSPLDVLVGVTRTTFTVRLYTATPGDEDVAVISQPPEMIVYPLMVYPISLMRVLGRVQRFSGFDWVLMLIPLSNAIRSCFA